jgi:ABC-type transport system involved in cytochrome c biogenesis permease subunit
MTTALVPAQSNWLVMHVTVMMLSYGALLAGCLLAICYLIVAFFSPRLSLAQTENMNVKKFKPELTATELPLTNELNLAWSSEINDKSKLIQVQLSATLDN